VACGHRDEHNGRVGSSAPDFEFGTDGPSLILVGASEHLGHRIVGSLAARLVRAGKWPVIVVP
jgi:hypothetical protein